MPAIKFDSSVKDAAKLPVPPPTPARIVIPAALLIQPKMTKPSVQIEWVRHTRVTCLAFLLVATVLTSYYSACFLSQYGTITLPDESHFKPAPVFNEATLTRVIMIQWLILAFVLLTGLSIFRRIFMPLYIFLAVMATNGTLVLFVVKMKQFADGKIEPDDLSLNLVGVLLVTATAHNLVYLYAMHLHLNRNYKRLLQKPTAAPAPAQQEKKPIDSFA